MTNSTILFHYHPLEAESLPPGGLLFAKAINAINISADRSAGTLYINVNNIFSFSWKGVGFVIAVYL